MEIKVIRNTFTSNSTIGELFINGEFKLYTIEDRDRGLLQTMSVPDILKVKVFGETCIPYGKYNLALTFSNRFEQYMPQILDVKGFEGIRQHISNRATEVEGCMGVGTKKDVDFIGNSKAAYTQYLSILKKVEKKEKITIEIVKG